MCRAVERLPETHVAAVHDRLEARARALASTYGGTIRPSLEALLADPGVDVVYVGLPHHLLAGAAAAAVAAGKHAVVEKPMGLEVAEIRSLERAAETNGVLVIPVFELRTTALFREARRLVNGGALGPIRTVRIRTVIDKPSSYWQSGPLGLVADSWRARRAEAGGGVVLMNSIHQLDAVRFLTDLSFVGAMAATGTFYADVEVEDTAVAVLRLSNGGLASLVATAHSPGAIHDERIELDGADGRLDLPDPAAPGPSSLRLYLRRPWGNLPPGKWIELDIAEVDAHSELLRAVVNAIGDRHERPACADDAAAALATVLAIYESAETGRAAKVSEAARDAD
jgi:1,5-anhydro-D-fructose reductase (1,5-anhydro-D-mannitol-forming)